MPTNRANLLGSKPSLLLQRSAWFLKLSCHPFCSVELVRYSYVIDRRRRRREVSFQRKQKRVSRFSGGQSAGRPSTQYNGNNGCDDNNRPESVLLLLYIVIIIFTSLEDCDLSSSCSLTCLSPSSLLSLLLLPNCNLDSGSRLEAKLDQRERH